MEIRTAAEFVSCVLSFDRKSPSGVALETMSEDRMEILGALHGISHEIIGSDGCSDRLATAGAFMCTSLDESCRAVLYAYGPPIEAATIAKTRHVGVACLGVAYMARWAVVPGMDINNKRVRWTEAGGKERESSLAQICKTVFENIANVGSLGPEIVNTTNAVASVTRQAGLLQTLLLAVQGVHGEASEAVWNSVGRDGGLQLIRVIDGIVRGVMEGVLDDETKQTCVAVVSGALHTIQAIPDTCGRQVAPDAKEITLQAVQSALPTTRVGVIPGGRRVAQAIMRLIRDRLAGGEADVSVAGLDVATSTLDSGADVEVREVAVSLLSEGLKRHWRAFWPGDVARATLTNGDGEIVDGNTGSTQTVRGIETVSRVYLKELGADLHLIVKEAGLACIRRIVHNEGAV